MKRYSVIDVFLSSLSKNDIVVLSGPEICKEAFVHHKENYIYLDEPFDISLSISIGLAMNTKKRVFLFLGEGEFLKNFSAVAQAGISRCKNLIIILLDNFGYQSSGGYPSIFESLTSKFNVFLTFNITVVNATHYFKVKKFVELRAFVKNICGPFLFFVELTPGFKKGLPEIDINYSEMILNTRQFSQKEEERPNVSFYIPENINTLNLDAAPGGIANGV